MTAIDKKWTKFLATLAEHRREALLNLVKGFIESSEIEEKETANKPGRPRKVRVDQEDMVDVNYDDNDDDNDDDDNDNDEDEDEEVVETKPHKGNNKVTSKKPAKADKKPNKPSSDEKKAPTPLLAKLDIPSEKTELRELASEIGLDIKKANLTDNTALKNVLVGIKKRSASDNVDYDTWLARANKMGVDFSLGRGRKSEEMKIQFALVAMINAGYQMGSK